MIMRGAIALTLLAVPSPAFQQISIPSLPPAKGAKKGAPTKTEPVKTEPSQKGTTSTAPARTPASGPASVPRVRAAPPATKSPTVEPLRDPFSLGLSFPALTPLKPPAMESVTLSNGLKVYLIENPHQPVTRGIALIRTGNLFDPPEKVGLAELTGAVLRTGGVKDKTGAQVDAVLEDAGATIESTIGETSGVIRLQYLRPKEEEVLGLLRQLLSEPQFDENALKLAKTRLRTDLARRNDDVRGVGRREFAERIYGRDTPYGWRIEYEHVDRIRREDLVAFHQRYYSPANLILGLQGDFPAAALKTRLEQMLGSWRASQTAVPGFPEVRPRPAPGIFVANRADLQQSFVLMGHLGGQLDDQDCAAMEVMAEALGGGFTSRLVLRTRTQMGWAHEIRAAWRANWRHPGYLEISAVTKSLASAQVMRAVMEEIEKIRTSEISRQDLDRARALALNNYVFHFDSPERMLDRLMTFEYFGYASDFIPRHQKALTSVTAADVLRAARQHLRPQDLTIVLVGNPRDSTVPLEDLRLKTENIDLAIATPVIAENKLDDQTRARGRELLAKMRQAMGGDARLAAVKDYQQMADVALLQAGKARIRISERFLAENHYRQDQELPNGRLSIYYDGKTGWVRQPQGYTGALSYLGVRQMASELFRLPFRLARSDGNSDRTVWLATDGMIRISDKNNQSVDLWIDQATGLPNKVVFGTAQVSGPPVSTEEIIHEWREIGGVQVPWRLSLSAGGRPYADVQLLECRFNAGLSAEELSKRP